jgi:hypothetical protein
MKLHFYDCAAEIKELKEQLILAQQQNIEFAREVVELSCKIRQLHYINKPIDCSTCKEKTQSEQIESIPVVIDKPVLE